MLQTMLLAMSEVMLKTMLQAMLEVKNIETRLQRAKQSGQVRPQSLIAWRLSLLRSFTRCRDDL